MGTTTFSGPVVSNNGFVGAITGNVTAGTITAATVSATGNLTADSGLAPAAGGMSAIQISSTAGLGIYVGSGLPTVSAAQGSLYIRTDGSSGTTRMYINTNGTTGWTAVNTVA